MNLGEELSENFNKKLVNMKNIIETIKKKQSKMRS